MVRNVMILVFMIFAVVTYARAESKAYSLTSDTRSNDKPMLGSSQVFYSVYSSKDSTATLNSYDLNNGFNSSFFIKNFRVQQQYQPLHNAQYVPVAVDGDKAAYLNGDHLDELSVALTSGNKVINRIEIYYGPNDTNPATTVATDPLRSPGAFGFKAGFLSWITRDSSGVKLYVADLNNIKAPFQDKPPIYSKYISNQPQTINSLTPVSIATGVKDFDGKLHIVIGINGNLYLNIFDPAQKNFTEYNLNFKVPNSSFPISMDGAGYFVLDVGNGIQAGSYLFNAAGTSIYSVVENPFAQYQGNSFADVRTSNGKDAYHAKNGNLYIFDSTNLIKTISNAGQFDLKNGELVYVQGGKIYYLDLDNSQSRRVGVRLADVEKAVAGNVGIGK